MDTLFAAALVAGISFVIGLAGRFGHISNISNLYVIGIALLASRRGLYPAVLASLLAFLAFDWFFIPPVHTFTVNDPSEYVALATLLATSMIIGQLLTIAHRRTAEAQRRQARTQLLYAVSEAALSNASVNTVYTLALERLNGALDLAASRLLLWEDSRLEEVAREGTPVEVQDEERIIQRVIDEGRPLGWQLMANNVRVVQELRIAEDGTISASGAAFSGMYVPLPIESRVEGVLVIGAARAPRLLTEEEAQLLGAFANQLAIAVQRERYADQEARARALEESDRLKSALISSVSHELKTPLAAIKASATSLLEVGDVDPEVRRELTESINCETDRLTRLVSNLLDMSRLDAGALQPHVEWVSIADVVAEVLDRLAPMLEGREVRVLIPDEIPPTPMDFVQVSQVLMNLVDNAVRYSPSGAGISISAEVVRDQLRVSVFNEGSRVPPSELDRLFEKFYRASDVSGGTGLGLAIARGIVEAHGGRIWAENVGQRGMAFSFTLPAPAREGGVGQAPPVLSA
ncbi:MAG: two-component system, OmpR family, sensor histidine kinase KdpD [Chloroflexota bacterium]|jgi:two-component system sensor histidine kinase KdpD|nr:two-component system, OmpR family, sensor histidine kinase KdpD [Chloroflexota bacterium]